MQPTKGTTPVVLFRYDAPLEYNLIQLFKDLYDFQEPFRDNIPWMYFVQRLERLAEDCRSPIESEYLESLMTVFRLHHFVNYQHISLAVLELSRWLSSTHNRKEMSDRSNASNENRFCGICRKYLCQVTSALFFRISFFGEHLLLSENTERIDCYRDDDFYQYTLSLLLGNDSSLSLSIWCDWNTLSQYENISSWDTFLLCPTAIQQVDNNCGVNAWKMLWIRPTWDSHWVLGYKPCIVSFIMQIHRHGRLGKVLKAKDAKTGVCYWICCINWLYTLVWMMSPPTSTVKDTSASLDNKILRWISEFCWNIQRIHPIHALTC
jgi:hypothetical protein